MLNVQLRKMLGSGRACLALFAAAKALKRGFVERHAIAPRVSFVTLVIILQSSIHDMEPFSPERFRC